MSPDFFNAEGYALLSREDFAPTENRSRQKTRRFYKDNFEGNITKSFKEFSDILGKIYNHKSI